LKHTTNQIIGTAGCDQNYQVLETSAVASCSPIIKIESGTTAMEIDADDSQCDQGLVTKIQVNQENWIEPKVEVTLSKVKLGPENTNVLDMLVDPSNSYEHKLHTCGVCGETFRSKQDQIRHTFRNHSTRK